MRNFWWGQKQKEPKMAWISWKRMCKPKAKGAMGFRSLQAFNLAVLAKQAWRILLNPNSLVSRVLKAKYFPTGDFLNAQLGNSPSYSQRSIYSSLEIIRKGTRWRVGNGKLIHIWEDRWLPTPSTYRVVSPLSSTLEFSMVSSLIDTNTKRWRVDLLSVAFLPFEVDAICKIPLCHNLPEDKLIWIGNKKGDFIVKMHIIQHMISLKPWRKGNAPWVIQMPNFGRSFDAFISLQGSRIWVESLY